MKKFYSWGIALLLSFWGLSSTLSAQTWEGDVSADWNTAGNWNTGAVPGTGDNVTVPAVTGPNVPPQLTSNVTVNRVTVDGGSLDLNGFTLETLGNSSRFRNNATITAGGSSRILLSDVTTAGWSRAIFLEDTLLVNGDLILENNAEECWNGIFVGADAGDSIAFNGNFTLRNSTSRENRFAVNGDVHFGGDLIIESTDGRIAFGDNEGWSAYTEGSGRLWLADGASIQAGAGQLSNTRLIFTRFTPENKRIDHPPFEMQEPGSKCTLVFEVMNSV